MVKIKFFPTEESLLDYAALLAKAIPDGAVIFLNGPLGAGKTTFTRGFLRGLGYSGKVKSPTYTLVEPYDLNERHIFHFDFYRLEKAQELEQIGLQEYFMPAAICLIEWPDKGFPYLPQPDLVCDIAFVGDGREIKIEVKTKRGEEIAARIE